MDDLAGLPPTTTLFISIGKSHHITVLILYSTDPEVQEKRAIRNQAMAEYYEKHGASNHH
jgi:hypothetical protein